MKALLKLSCFIVVLGLLAPEIGMAQGSDYCSLIVNLINANGTEAAGRRTITVTEADGRTVSQEYQQGGASFCDLGVLPVTITVASPYCFQVTMRNVSVGVGKTKAVKIVSNNEGDCSNVDTAPAPWCNVLLRFKDEDGKWIPNVTLSPIAPAKDFREIDPTHRRVSFPQSGKFGRIIVVVDLNAELHAKAIRDGYIPQDVDLPCNSQTYNNHERILVLRKEAKQ
jgi:hypothetical protein